jgi:hypothetical protein
MNKVRFAGKGGVLSEGKCNLLLWRACLLFCLKSLGSFVVVGYNDME